MSATGSGCWSPRWRAGPVVELKGSELGLDLAAHPDAVSSVVATVKEREATGWSFEAADASLELLMRSALGETATAPFALDSYRVITEHRADGHVVAEATVKVVVDGRGCCRRPRATARSTRSTRRCGPRWRRRARGWPTSRCRTTRCGSSRGARTP